MDRADLAYRLASEAKDAAISARRILMRQAGFNEDRQRADELVIEARTRLIGRGDHRETLELARRLDVPSRVMSVIEGGAGAQSKAAVPPGSRDNPANVGITDAATIATAFVSSLSQQSVFARLLDGLAVPVPFKTRITYMPNGIEAYLVLEGAPVPVSAIEAPAEGLEPQKAAALVVLTAELARSTGADGVAFIREELRKAVGTALDRGLFASILAGAPTVASTGDAAADLKALLTLVTPKAGSRLLFAAAPDVALTASTLVGASGNFVFPGMSPTGGTMLGIETMASDEVPAGTLTAIDGAGIGANMDVITLDASYEATIELASAPPEGVTKIGLFQSNQIGLMARCFFGVAKTRDNAAASLTGIAWGAP